MAEVTVTIGGHDFEVACRDGEEHFLKSAAAMLDAEASALRSALGRMPEARMLLMAGLMLADKTASLEDKVKESDGDDRVNELTRRLRRTERQLGQAQTALADARSKLEGADTDGAASKEAAVALKKAQGQAAEHAKAAKVANQAASQATDALSRIVEKLEAAAKG